ncbi:MAG: DUF4476 domain-containing protein [Bacteroidetes bacterium]|nr:DUF4476 domain-containing protein [Bacteroidota bacterium]
MKKNLSLIVVLMLAASISIAQTANAVLFTENGEKFFVILNGLRKNEKAQTNVRLTELTSMQYKLKIIFESAELGEVNTNLFLEPGTERSFSVKKNNKGTYVLRMVSEDLIRIDVADVEPPPPPPPSPADNYSTGGTVQHSVTTTTTSGGNTDNVNIGMTVGEGGISINASGFDDDGLVHQQTTVTTTTTTTHSGHTVVSGNTPPPPPPPAYVPGYTGPIGCPHPMDPGSFSELKQTISSKSFEDSKMTIAKQVLRDRCLIVSQIKEICQLFTFEDNKLTFAKYAYSYAYDKGNYFKINDVFTFETSIEELNEYIGGR